MKTIVAGLLSLQEENLSSVLITITECQKNTENWTIAKKYQRAFPKSGEKQKLSRSCQSTGVHELCSMLVKYYHVLFVFPVIFYRLKYKFMLALNKN